MSNTVASVVYDYSPKNEDELELRVGDRIEVLGVDEEGWWRGRLNGKIGVFPSNFVQVVENSTPPTSQPAANSSSPNKVNAFSKLSRTSLSSNSLNSNSSGGPSVPNNHNNTNPNSNSTGNFSQLNNNNINNNNITDSSNKNSTNNLMMNSTQTDSSHTVPMQSAGIADSPGVGERRPKPIKGVGYGDIFAAGATSSATGKATKASPGNEPVATSLVSERFANSLASTLQKQIPKKPPPPAPSQGNVANSGASSADNGLIGGAAADQAPALPPKPANQFSPHIPAQPHSAARPQMLASSLTAPSQLSATVAALVASRAQQQINKLQHQQKREQARVIFAYEPSNDDELGLEVGDIIDVIDKNIEDAGWWKGELRGKIGVFPDNFVQLIENSAPGEPTIPTQTSEAAHQPDWFSNAPTNTSHVNTANYSGVSAATASLQQASQTTPLNPTENKVRSVFANTPKGFSKELENNLERHSVAQAVGGPSFLSLKRNKLPPLAPEVDSPAEGNPAACPVGERKTMNDSSDSSPTKLNHITVNRARGPNRRPPSNISNKRSQGDTLRRDPNGREEDSSIMTSLPVTASHVAPAAQVAHESLDASTVNEVTQLPSTQHQLSQSTTLQHTSPKVSSSINDSPIKSNDLESLIDGQPAAPKSSQRLSQATPTVSSNEPVKSNSNTPPWMLELRKAHAEKKRDSFPVSNVPTQDDNVSIGNGNNHDSSPKTPTGLAVNTNSVSKPFPIPAMNQVNAELASLRDDVKRLQAEVLNLSDLKNVIESFKADLKACRDATENQKRYMKELVSSLAEERKRLASMQAELN